MTLSSKEFQIKTLSFYISTKGLIAGLVQELNRSPDIIKKSSELETFAVSFLTHCLYIPLWNADSNAASYALQIDNFLTNLHQACQISTKHVKSPLKLGTMMRKDYNKLLVHCAVL